MMDIASKLWHGYLSVYLVVSSGCLRIEEAPELKQVGCTIIPQ